MGRFLLFRRKVLTFKEINCMFQFEFRELCPILFIKSLLPLLCMFYFSFFTEHILVVQERYCSATYLGNGPLQFLRTVFFSSWFLCCYVWLWTLGAGSLNRGERVPAVTVMFSLRWICSHLLTCEHVRQW